MWEIYGRGNYDLEGVTEELRNEEGKFDEKLGYLFVTVHLVTVGRWYSTYRGDFARFSSRNFEGFQRSWPLYM